MNHVHDISGTVGVENQHVVGNGLFAVPVSYNCVCNEGMDSTAHSICLPAMAQIIIEGGVTGELRWENRGSLFLDPWALGTPSHWLCSQTMVASCMKPHPKL